MLVEKIYQKRGKSYFEEQTNSEQKCIRLDAKRYYLFGTSPGINRKNPQVLYPKIADFFRVSRLEDNDLWTLSLGVSCAELSPPRGFFLIFGTKEEVLDRNISFAVR